MVDFHAPWLSSIDLATMRRRLVRLVVAFKTGKTDRVNSYSLRAAKRSEASWQTSRLRGAWFFALL